MDKKHHHSKKATSSKQRKGSQTTLSTISEESKSHTTDNNVSPFPNTNPLPPGIQQDEKITKPRKCSYQGKKMREERKSREEQCALMSCAQPLNEMPLFSTVVTDNNQMGSKTSSKTSIENTFLITGFGMRNWESLHNALQEEERKRLRELYKTQEKGSASTISASSIDVCISQESSSSTRTTTTSTFTTEESEEMSEGKKKVKYLMGLTEKDFPEEEHEEPDLGSIFFDKSIDEAMPGVSEAMRLAQRYLRTHKIFELFQYLICHLLSALPDNPIDFIMEQLDKLLLYRAGFGDPPLLYTKRHLEQLFYLMDRMRTGFIDLNQYNTGMKTLGICFYETNPVTTIDKLVPKDVFINEAYECLTTLLHEMIRRRYSGAPPPCIPPAPPTSHISTYLDNIGGG